MNLNLLVDLYMIYDCCECFCVTIMAWQIYHKMFALITYETCVFSVFSHYLIKYLNRFEWVKIKNLSIFVWALPSPSVVPPQLPLSQSEWVSEYNEEVLRKHHPVLLCLVHPLQLLCFKHQLEQSFRNKFYSTEFKKLNEYFDWCLNFGAC